MGSCKCAGRCDRPANLQERVAVAWGMAEARTRVGVASFWAAAAVRDTVHRSCEVSATLGDILDRAVLSVAAWADSLGGHGLPEVHEILGPPHGGAAIGHNLRFSPMPGDGQSDAGGARPQFSPEGETAGGAMRFSPREPLSEEDWRERVGEWLGWHFGPPDADDVGPGIPGRFPFPGTRTEETVGRKTVQKVLPGRVSEEAGVACCVEEFDYPRTWRGVAGVVGSRGGRRRHEIKIEFETFAEYSPRDSCRCMCCQFRQFVVLGSFPERIREDCYVFDRTGADGGRLKPVALEPGELADTDARPMICPGDRRPPNADTSGLARGVRSMMDAPGAAKTEYESGGCRMTFSDKPGIEFSEPHLYGDETVPTQPRISWRALLIGVIEDTCNNNAMKDIGVFEINLSGRQVELGTGKVWNQLAKPPLRQHIRPIYQKSGPTELPSIG